jgi:hypothetical protein
MVDILARDSDALILDLLGGRYERSFLLAVPHLLILSYHSDK